MANIVFNIAKGRVAELYNRVEDGDPANAALVLVPIETSGLESDATLIDKDDLAAVLSGATNEQTTMGRKVLTATELASIPAPDDSNDRADRSLPDVTWSAASGNAVAKMLVGYDPDTTGGSDSTIVPLALLDCAFTPNGLDFRLLSGVFFRAS